MTIDVDRTQNNKQNNIFDLLLYRFRTLCVDGGCFFLSTEYIDVGPDCLSKLIMKSELMLCSQSYLGVPESMGAPTKYTREEVDAFCR